MVKTIEVTAPAFWASYLINGDATSFDHPDSVEGEQDEAAAMIEDIGGYCVDASEPHFMGNPGYGMAGDCCTYTFILND